MKVPSLRLALVLGIVLAGSGCGARNASPDTTGVLPPTSARRAPSWISPNAKSAKELLYVADPFLGNIDIFSMQGLKATLVGQIADSDGPDGMTTDAAGNLYVTDEGVATEGPAAGDIKIYPKGSTIYSRYIVPAKWVPFDVAVGSDGTMYVSNIAPIGYFSPGSVSVYMPGASVPARVLHLKSFQAYGIALHHHSKTIYVSYEAPGSDGGKIAAFAHARGKAKDLGVNYPEPWGLLEDGSNDLLACDGAGIIEVYAESDGKLVQQISVPNGAAWIAFDKSRSHIFVSNFDQIEILSYPGGTVLGSINQGWGKTTYPTGVAIWPPPP